MLTMLPDHHLCSPYQIKLTLEFGYVSHLI
jgi:hypothetical protein